MQKQTCNRCRKPKDNSEFAFKSKADGILSKRCRQCQATARVDFKTNSPEKYKAMRRRCKLKERYGITIEQYDQMVIAQNGKCSICGSNKMDARGRFHIDHDHRTGKVRALLCFSCNTGLGNFADSPEVLRAAAEYLERMCC